MSSTAWWSWDARTTSASPNLGRGWGSCASSPHPCNTASGATTGASPGRTTGTAGETSAGQTEAQARLDALEQKSREIDRRVLKSICTGCMPGEPETTGSAASKRHYGGSTAVLVWIHVQRCAPARPRCHSPNCHYGTGITPVLKSSEVFAGSPWPDTVKAQKMAPPADRAPAVITGECYALEPGRNSLDQAHSITPSGRGCAWSSSAWHGSRRKALAFFVSSFTAKLSRLMGDPAASRPLVREPRSSLPGGRGDPSARPRRSTG